MPALRHVRLRQRVREIMRVERVTAPELARRYPGHVLPTSLRRFVGNAGNPRSRVLAGIHGLLTEYREDRALRPELVTDEAPALSTTDAPLISDDGPRGSGVLSRIQAGVGNNEDQLQKLVAILPRLIRLCDEFGV